MQRLPQRLPGTGGLVRVGSGEHSNHCFHLHGYVHRLALLLPFQDQPISSGAAAVFRRSGAPAAQTYGRLVAIPSRLLVQKPALPFPKIDRAAGVEKGLPRTQLELAQGLRPADPAKAVELLTMDAEDKPETVPPKNSAEDLI